MYIGYMFHVYSHDISMCIVFEGDDVVLQDSK